MMLSVLVWLAMWGQVQAQTPDLSQLTDPGIVRPLAQYEGHAGTIYGPRSYCAKSADGRRVINCPDPHVPWDEDPSMLGDNHAPSKPAEHVIEIKTVRKDHGVAKGIGRLGGSPQCDKPDDSLEYPNQCKENICTSMYYIAPHCVKLTRELWIDGTKFGVIKGLD